jgi:post-segregation antitoxin (ccd killing protein)
MDDDLPIIDSSPNDQHAAWQAARSQWLAENQSAVDEYNRRIEAHGTFSDGLRRF